MKYLFRKLKSLIPIGNPSQRCIRKLRALPVRPGEIAIDCGANVGSISQILAEAGGQVFAFEPNPHAFEVLEATFQDVPNVTCFSKGVFSEPGNFNLFLHEDSEDDPVKWSTGSSLLDCKTNVNSEAFVEVELVDLSKFIEDLDQQVKLLKLDVEGVEYKILEQLIETGMIDKIDQVFVETHEQQIPEIQEESERVRALIAARGIKHISLDWV